MKSSFLAQLATAPPSPATIEVDRRSAVLAEVNTSLQRLFHISDSVFNQLERTMQVQDTRLAGLQDRIAICKGRQEKTCSLTIFPKLPEQASPLARRQALFSDFPVYELAEEQESSQTQLHVGGRGYVADPIITPAAMSDFQHKIAKQRAHKRAMMAQLISQRELPRVENKIVANGEKRRQEQVLGPAPVSLLRENLLGKPLAAKEKLLAGEEEENGQELSFLHQSTASAKEHSLDALNLPSDLTQVLGSRIYKERRARSKPAHAVAEEDEEEEAKPVEEVVVVPVVEKEKMEEVEALPSRTAAVPRPLDFLAAIRSKPKLSPATTTQQPAAAAAANKPKTLAEEMRERLNRRQALLSGEKDEEEQLFERRRHGGKEEEEDARSFASLSTIGMPVATARRRPPPRRTATVAAGAEQTQTLPPLMPSFDRVFEREMSKKDLFNKGKSKGGLETGSSSDSDAWKEEEEE